MRGSGATWWGRDGDWARVVVCVRRVPVIHTYRFPDPSEPILCRRVYSDETITEHASTSDIQYSVQGLCDLSALSTNEVSRGPSIWQHIKRNEMTTPRGVSIHFFSNLSPLDTSRNRRTCWLSMAGSLS